MKLPAGRAPYFPLFSQSQIESSPGDRRTSCRRRFSPAGAHLRQIISLATSSMAEPGAEVWAVLGHALFILVTSICPISLAYGVFLLRNKFRQPKQPKMKDKDLQRRELFFLRREQELRAQVSSLQAALAQAQGQHALAELQAQVARLQDALAKLQAQVARLQDALAESQGQHALAGK